MKNFLVIAIVFWLLFMNGLSAVKQWTSTANLGPVVTTISTGAGTVLNPPTPAVPPTSRPAIAIPQVVARAPAPASVAEAPAAVVVVPQGEYHVTATPMPPAGVVEVPAVPAEVQAAYDAVLSTPTPIPDTAAGCGPSGAPYKTNPQEISYNGVPIGRVQGWSCTSAEEANARGQKLGVEMLNKYLDENGLR